MERAFPAAAGVDLVVESPILPSHTAKGQKQDANPSLLTPKPLNHHPLALHSPVKGGGGRHRRVGRGSSAGTKLW